MLKVEFTTKFKSDLKRSNRRNKNLLTISNIMKLIEHQKLIPTKFKDHPLTGNWIGYRELHIEPDWLLIYKLAPKEKTVIFIRNGSHSDLFE